MKAQAIITALKDYIDEGKTLFATSSFQTHSIPLLHLIHRSGLDIPIYCINTGFHFPETLKFRDYLATRFSLDIRTVSSDIPKSQQRDADGNFYFTSDPDYCCYINKVLPVKKLCQQYDIWINGIRADQNSNRKSINKTAPSGHGAMRFHPMLDWTRKDIDEYIAKYKLPPHPLEGEGYTAV